MSFMDARTVAFTPLGSSMPAAIVAASVFFVTGLIGIANLIYTKYPWYDVVIAACFFRSISYSCRAAYLGGPYRPALQGVFLAFVNSGYGASVVTVCLTHAWWYKYKPAVVFTPWMDYFMKKFSMVLAFVCVCCGPVLGVLAAGFIYGAYDDPILGHRGVRLRIAVSYGILGANVAIVLMTAISCIRAFWFPSPTLRDLHLQKHHTRKNPRLIILLLMCGVLLLIRGSTGVATLYESKSYLWQDDKFFYPLDTLPEVMSFVVICWPAALARIAMFWPSKDRSIDEESDPQNRKNPMTQGDKAEVQSNRDAQANQADGYHHWPNGHQNGPNGI